MTGSTLLLMIALVVFSSVESAKILLIVTPTYSHCAEVSTVGQELVDRGHSAFVLFSVTHKHNNCHLKHANGTKRINTIMLNPTPDILPTETVSKVITDSMISGEKMSIGQFLPTLTTITSNVCGNLLSDTNTLLALKEEGFDLVLIGGGFMNYCSLVIPYILKVPYVSIASAFEDFVSGRPFLPSISPNILAAGTDSMTFLERLMNAAGHIGLHAIAYYTLPMDFIKPLAPELSRRDVVNLASKSELFLYNYDTVLAYPVPKMPNHVFVGGIGIKPPAPITGELDKYYKQSPNGVVLVTFGGNSMDLPKAKVDELLRVFQKIKFNVLWKYGEGGQFGNVKQMKWVPQNDLLGHPNTILFVSHCGNNGVFEALYNGVPLVCTPIIGDQPYNGARVEHWEVGLSVPLLKSTEEEIHSAILEVLSNPKYRKNMKRASEMYHDQPQTPRQRAGDAIENVLKFGGGHLRSRASDMSVFTYMGYDLVCFVMGVLILIDFLIYKCFMFACRRCRAPPKEKTN